MEDLDFDAGVSIVVQCCGLRDVQLRNGEGGLKGRCDAIHTLKFRSCFSDDDCFRGSVLRCRDETAGGFPRRALIPSRWIPQKLLPKNQIGS